MAYFEQLGAVGYTSSPVVLWAEPAPGTQRINRLRTRLAAAMMAAMPGDAGAFAAGAMTGDRSGISQDTVQALRDSNLAHLLAISGMNMAFITGFVFMLVRYGVALIPPLALRINAKKLAAVVAFGVALFYLQLSGANVATERAFLMVVVMLGAVLLDRRGVDHAVGGAGGGGFAAGGTRKPGRAGVSAVIRGNRRADRRVRGAGPPDPARKTAALADAGVYAWC